jgi:hypothetical protein
MKELTRLSVQRRRFRISNPIGSGAPMMLTRAVAWLNTSAGAAYSWLARCTVAVVDEQETVGVALSSLPMRHITPSPRAAYSLWLRVVPTDLSQCGQLPDLGSYK